MSVPRRDRNTLTQTLRRADRVLTEYGRHRLEPDGWRELGIGSLTAAGQGFRAFALTPATDWATYEFPGRHGQTVAEIAASHPGTMPAAAFEAVRALSRSRLAPYRVVSHRNHRTVLRHEFERHTLVLGATARGPAVLPRGALVAARWVESGALPTLLHSFVLADEAAQRLAIHQRSGRDRLSRATLEAVLAQVYDVDIMERAATIEPALGGQTPSDVARLDRAMVALEHTLRDTPAEHRRWSVPGGELSVDRSRNAWRVGLTGRVRAGAQRIPRDVAHPFDVEFMRQIGVTDYVVEVWGAVDQLACAMAHAAVRPMERAA